MSGLYFLSRTAYTGPRARRHYMRIFDIDTQHDEKSLSGAADQLPADISGDGRRWRTAFLGATQCRMLALKKRGQAAQLAARG